MKFKTFEQFETVNEYHSAKDDLRIKDIISKADGSEEKELSLATTMANSIKDVEKCLGRAEAAKDSGKYEIAKIFLDKAKLLGADDYSFRSLSYDVREALTKKQNKSTFEDRLKGLESNTEIDKDGIFYMVGIPTLHRQMDNDNIKGLRYALTRIVQHLANQQHVWVMPRSYNEESQTLTVQVSPNFTYPKVKLRAAFREYPKLLADYLNKGFGEGTAKVTRGKAEIVIMKDINYKKLFLSVVGADLKTGAFEKPKSI